MCIRDSLKPIQSAISGGERSRAVSYTHLDVYKRQVYVILGYDADSFQLKGGTPWFDKALKIAQNSQNQNYNGWSQVCLLYTSRCV